MQAKRGRVRIAVDIPVVITTVLDSLEATLVNLSLSGAQVKGPTLPKGTQFQLDCDGHTVFAKVMWVEIDRMGVRFPFDMQDGPLFEILERARTGKPLRRTMPAGAMVAPAAAGPVMSGFGKRIG